jgi:hypothetical protein
MFPLLLPGAYTSTTREILAAKGGTMCKKVVWYVVAREEV